MMEEDVATMQCRKVIRPTFRPKRKKSRIQTRKEEDEEKMKQEEEEDSQATLHLMSPVKKHEEEEEEEEKGMKWRTIGWKFGVCVFCEVLFCRKYGRWYNERGYCYERIPESAKLEEEEEEEEEEKCNCYEEAFGWCHLCKPKKEEEEEEEEEDKYLDMMDSDGEADEIERPWWYAYRDIETKEQICEYCRSYFLVGNCGT